MQDLSPSSRNAAAETRGATPRLSVDASLAGRLCGVGKSMLVREARKNYGGERRYKKLTLHVAPAEFLTLLGASGSGR